ncbi:flagellar hook-length control protein FliK [Caldalkalibacillus uzonensis]|uniref:Flagellar hook-length control protein FliK n=1 Tax=Caldalkalibacillus uzonensis TaxID=353224 RepID=A0ABU0CLI4_9BACI|nr:flagellar hook-length control protein FliK [Caldalkalibacillus uzonensis]MDQ0337268.1 flagellar hook-length control protein FliK [Caldalkalibacillus uzonensis]
MLDMLTLFTQHQERSGQAKVVKGERPGLAAKEGPSTADTPLSFSMQFVRLLGELEGDSFDRARKQENSASDNSAGKRGGDFSLPFNSYSPTREWPKVRESNTDTTGDLLFEENTHTGAVTPASPEVSNEEQEPRFAQQVMPVSFETAEFPHSEGVSQSVQLQVKTIAESGEGGNILKDAVFIDHFRPEQQQVLISQSDKNSLFKVISHGYPRHLLTQENSVYDSLREEAAPAGNVGQAKPGMHQLLAGWSADQGLAPSAQSADQKGFHSSQTNHSFGEQHTGTNTLNLSTDSTLTSGATEATKSVQENGTKESTLVRYAYMVQDLEQVLRMKWNRVQEGNVTQIRIQIHPEHLGEMDIRLTSNEGKMTIQILASTRFALESLDRHMYQLQAVLAQQGLQVERIEVIHQQLLSQELSGQHDKEGHRHAHQGQDQQSTAKETARDKSPEQGDYIAHYRVLGDSATVDYVV